MKTLNYVLRWCFVLVGVLVSGTYVAASLEKVGKKLLAPVEQGQKIFTTIDEEKRKLHDQLIEEKAQQEKESKEFLAKIKERNDGIAQDLEKVTEELKRQPEDEFLNKKLALLHEHDRIIKHWQQLYDQIATTQEQHIALLQDYLKDLNLQEYKKVLNIADKDTFTFEDLHQLNELIVNEEKTIAQLHEQEKSTDIELENRNRTAAATLEEYKKKKEEYERSLSIVGPEIPFDLDNAQKQELLRIEEQINNDKKEREALWLKEIEQKKSFIKSKLFIQKLRLGILKEALAKVKPAIKVSEAGIAYDKDELSKRRQHALANKELYRHKIEVITKELKIREKELQEISARVGIASGADIDEWVRQPAESMQGYKNFLEIARTNSMVLLLARDKELLEAQNAFEDEQLRLAAIQIDVKTSFHKITERAFVSEQEAKFELKKYEATYAELKAHQILYKERRNTNQEKLLRQKKVLSVIQELRKKIQDRKNTVFRLSSDSYIACLELLAQSQEYVQQQIDVLGKLVSMYSDIINELNSAIKQIDFITSELELTTIWQRSKYAITWEGILNIIPNLELFVADVSGYVASMNSAALGYVIKDQMQHPYQLAMFILAFLLAILLAKFVVPYCMRLIMHFGMRYTGTQVISFFVAFILGFISKYIISIYFWLSVFFLLEWHEVTDPYIYIIFYLVSIPYLLYIANRCIQYFAQFNSKHEYIFLDKDFQRRFVVIISIFTYATIFIVLFREAFILAAYYKSELPTILLAINFIIFQISLIFLIAKEQILSIIPEHGDMWNWVRDQVDHFYYLILMFAVAIIVMSNPYVGFGKLVLYILLRLLYTIILIRILVWVHTLFKKMLTFLFFSKTEDHIRERFIYSKTLYGIFILGVFVTAIVFGLIIGAKIWHWPEVFANVHRWSDILSWLQTPLMLEKTENPISVYSILKIVMFIVAGFMIAAAINLFILEKIFDVLLADSGVQNTISSMARYLIIMIAVILGFQSVGLGELVWWLILTLGVGIGWVIKDPLGDFIAYFIILVQRPVKIGDYIFLDQEHRGVVRKITPRSVVVRRSNSVTIVLPNSDIISKPIMNWNYTRGFIAFDDIIIGVSYKADPTKVKAILLKVLDENQFVLKSPNPVVRLNEFGNYGFVFMARGYISSNYTLDQWDIASDVRLAMIKALRDQNIELALSTRIMLDKDSEQKNTAPDYIESK